MGAVKYQKTPTSDAPWDAGANVKNLKSGQEASYYEKMYAWVDPDANEQTKGAYKFPHHEVGTNGDIGAANVKACQSIIAILNGSMGGTNIPAADKQTVYDHAAQHLKDGGVTPAEFKKSFVHPHGIRSLVATDFNVRTEGEGDVAIQFIEGYALKFNTPSVDIGFWVPIIETIDPHALDNCDVSDVKCLFNHDPNSPLGRNTIQSGPGSLQLSIDNIGLHFKCQPTNTTYAADLIQNMQAGIINQCSFAFDEPDDEDAEEVVFNDTTKTYNRTIKEISVLYDVSPVTYPAYPDTDCVVGERSLEKIYALEQQRQVPKIHKDQEDDTQIFRRLAQINLILRRKG
jgi:HK97 family phage prohead protease